MRAFICLFLSFLMQFAHYNALLLDAMLVKGEIDSGLFFSFEQNEYSISLSSLHLLYTLLNTST